MSDDLATLQSIYSAVCCFKQDLDRRLRDSDNLTTAVLFGTITLCIEHGKVTRLKLERSVKLDR